VERGNIHLYAPVPETRPLAIARLRPVELRSLLDAHLTRVQLGSVRKAQRRGAMGF
jgi:hypothetical protein